MDRSSLQSLWNVWILDGNTPQCLDVVQFTRFEDRNAESKVQRRTGQNGGR